MEPVLEVAARASQENFVPNDHRAGEATAREVGGPGSGEFGRDIGLYGVPIAFRPPETRPIRSLGEEGA